jgi:hypothetical protein
MFRYLLLLLPALVLAQTAQNSVTVTASRNSNLPPDQAVVGVNVNTATSGSLDDAVAALVGSGMTASNFTGVSTVQDYSGSNTTTQLQWSFAVTMDLTALKATFTQLAAVQQAVASKKNGTAISFGVQNTQVSQKAAQSQPCSLSGLISDARAQAQQLAAAANMTVGQVLAVSGLTATAGAGVGGSAYSYTPSAPACSLTVKFALTGGI